MNISTRDLQAFLALAEEKHFTRAAARCCLSQSAFSARIGAIEQALGARLFDRTTRSVELTAEGALFMESARRLHSEFSEVVENFRDHAARRKGRVALAALPSLVAAWLPAVMAGYRQAHPGIELSLTDTMSEECLALLRAGQVDLAIAAGVSAAEDLESQMLCADPFFLVCREDHPLAACAQPSGADVAAHPMVHIARRSSVRNYLDLALHPASIHATFEVQHLASVASLVEAGLGVTVVPGLTLFHFHRPGLVVRPMNVPGLVRRIYLVRRRGRSLSPAARAMYEHILAARAVLENLSAGYGVGSGARSGRSPQSVAAVAGARR
ncbi:LysR family transcriptional regulator [Verticiella sediminum]|uniref:LysR family transcriptional regulator n=1 Tax=Verticiella sediminum TaxID=1247510 RepID=A0A556AZF2_9BURK|nr:LysR family transcriptional regulator [Verticiella sediminum]TSH98320.1 LysR family transcriptional regulator [Verticiella sediminum]